MAWAKVYTDEQRAAVITAWCDIRTRPAGKIAIQARQGELVCDGKKLAPFEIPETMVREIGNKDLKRRRGLANSKLADLPPRDAVESLRRRLCSVTEHEINRVEDEQRRKGSQPIDGQRLAKLGRAIREIAAIPGPTDPRPPSPPPQKAAAHDQTLAGKLRRSIRGTNGTTAPTDPADPVQTPPTTPPTPQENTQGHKPTPTPPHNTTPHHTQTPPPHEARGAAVRAEFGALLAERVTVREG